MMQTINSKKITLTMNSSLRKTPLTKKFVKEINNWIPIISSFILKDLKSCGADHLYLNLMICGDHKVQRLNREYRNKDKTTDVLSFPVYENLRSGNEQLFGPVDLGDIVVSWPVVLKQAKEFKVTNEQELIHLFVHGVLHLIGYDHELSRKEEIIMEKYEQELVKKIYKKL
jgi:probable rRNA maturation factor